MRMASRRKCFKKWKDKGGRFLWQNAEAGCWVSETDCDTAVRAMRKIIKD